MTPAIEAAVRDLIGADGWSIAPASGGSRVRSWVVREAGGPQLFVKVAADANLLGCLGQIDVGPRVIASGSFGHEDLVVQEYVDGAAPEARWLDGHIGQVGELMNRYHGEQRLRVGPSRLTQQEMTGSLWRRLNSTSSNIAPELRQLLAEAIGAINGSTSDVPAGEWVLTHGDPNTANFILRRDGRLTLVDWDEARLSDPVRDIGQVLWWYVRPERWPAGLTACGLADDASVRQRIHWWAAAESVDVALDLIDAADEIAATAFARDALAAARGEHNPRAWWLDEA